MNIPALANRMAPGRAGEKPCAVADMLAVYVDGKPIALRPQGLSDCDWETVCRRLTMRAPSSTPLTFSPAAPDDPAAWKRMEAYWPPEPS